MSGLEAAGIVLGLIVLRFVLPVLLTLAVGFITDTILNRGRVAL